MITLNDAANTLKIKVSKILEYAVKGKIIIGTSLPKEKVLFLSDETVIHDFVADPNFITDTSKIGLTYNECYDRKSKYVPFPNSILSPPHSKVSIHTLCITENEFNYLKKILPKTNTWELREPSMYEFFFNSNTWTITYEGKTIHPVDSKGLKYIHYLLSFPKKEIDAFTLRSEIDKVQPSKYKNRSEGTFINEGLEISRSGNTKTRTSRIKMKDELDSSIEQSNKQADDESEMLEKKCEKLRKELKELEDIKEIKEALWSFEWVNLV